MLTFPFRPARATRAATVALLALPLVVAACGGGSTPSPSGSTTPAPSTGDPAAAQALAATIPTTVGDVTLTVDSGDLTAVADDIPSYDDLVARLRNADVEPADVLAAVGRPESGGTDPTVAGLEVVDAPPGGLGMLAMMEAWASGIPGATTEGTNVGKPVTMVTFADGTAPLYYYLYDTDAGDEEDSDTLYLVQSADQTLAEDALSQLP